MTLSDDSDLRIGEYVLGTLETEERRKLEALAAENPAVAAAMVVWELRLAPLHELVVPVEPPESVWPRIEERLEKVKQAARARDPGFFETVTELARAQGAASAVQLVERLRRWRAAAVLAGVIAVSLAGFLVAEFIRTEPAPTVSLIAVLHSDAFAPPFVVVLDPGARTLEVKSVPAVTPDDRSYAFWLVADEQAPVLLGRLRGTGVLKPEAFARLDRATLRGATIGVTIEREGASPDAPSGPFAFRGAFDLQ